MKAPAHLKEYQDWLVHHDEKALGTARLYARFLTRCAEHYRETIDENTIRSDADIQGVIGRVSKVVATRGRWAKGTFNVYDVNRNLVFAHAYARFAREAFPESSHAQSTTLTSETAADLPLDEMPERLRQTVSRLVRDTKIIRDIKALYERICQLCGDCFELKPGEFYAEVHHLKPLGMPHRGDDKKENMICVCPSCHVRLDFLKRFGSNQPS